MPCYAKRDWRWRVTSCRSTSGQAFSCNRFFFNVFIRSIITEQGLARLVLLSKQSPEVALRKNKKKRTGCSFTFSSLVRLSFGRQFVFWLLVCLFGHFSVCSFTCSFMHLFVSSPVRWFVWSFIRSFLRINFIIDKISKLNC